MVSKLIISVFIVLCFYVGISAQSDITKTDLKNLYYVAFSAYLEKRNHMYEGNEYLRKHDYLTILVEKNLHLTEGLPTVIGKNTIEYLDYAERISKFKKLRGEFRLIVIRPIKNTGNTLVISFGEYLWSNKKNNSIYSLSDDSRVELRFDYVKQEFVVEKVDLWGV